MCCSCNLIGFFWQEAAIWLVTACKSYSLIFDCLQEATIWLVTACKSYNLICDCLQEAAIWLVTACKKLQSDWWLFARSYNLIGDCLQEAAIWLVTACKKLQSDWWLLARSYNLIGDCLQEATIWLVTACKKLQSDWWLLARSCNLIGFCLWSPKFELASFDSSELSPLVLIHVRVQWRCGAQCIHLQWITCRLDLPHQSLFFLTLVVDSDVVQLAVLSLSLFLSAWICNLLYLSCWRFRISCTLQIMFELFSRFSLALLNFIISVCATHFMNIYEIRENLIANYFIHETDYNIHNKFPLPKFNKSRLHLHAG